MSKKVPRSSKRGDVHGESPESSPILLGKGFRGRLQKVNQERQNQRKGLRERGESPWSYPRGGWDEGEQDREETRIEETSSK